MVLTDIQTKTYELGDGFYVDIVELATECEAYLWHEDYCVKTMAFGVSKEQTNVNSFVELFEANAQEYIDAFIVEYFED